MHKGPTRLSTLALFIKKRLMLNRLPVLAFYETTKTCNLHCLHCRVSAQETGKAELNTNEAKNLIKDLKELKISTIKFTGGEPLLRKDILELIAYSASLKISAILETNGILLTENLAFELKKYGLKGIGISLDGSCEEVHSLTRDKGSFELIMQGMKIAVKTDLPVLICVTLHKNNRHDLENIVKLLVNNNIRYCVARLAMSCGRGIQLNETQRLTLDESLEIVKEVHQLSQRYKDNIIFPFMGDPFLAVYEYKHTRHKLFSKFLLELTAGCSLIKGNLIHINADGGVKPCPNFPYNLQGINVKTHSIIDVFQNNPLLKRLRNRNNLKGKCRVCKYQFLCGGCRVFAYSQTGDPFEGIQDCPLFEK